jgi:hypothetical protein
MALGLKWGTPWHDAVSTRVEACIGNGSMGHVNHQYPPDTIKWRKVVAALLEGEDAVCIAQATLDAASKGIRIAKADEGLALSVWMLARLTVAARSDDPALALTDLGLSPDAFASMADLAASVSDALDQKLSERRARTDIGEMAQMAAIEALARVLGGDSEGLFGPTPEPVQQRLAAMATEKGFARLGHQFFARFYERFLGYHLSRELPQHVGPGERFPDARSQADFQRQLTDHANEVSLITKEFSGGWYSSSRYRTGLSQKSAADFASYALEKISQEVARRSRRDVA